MRHTRDILSDLLDAKPRRGRSLIDGCTPPIFPNFTSPNRARFDTLPSARNRLCPGWNLKPCLQGRFHSWPHPPSVPLAARSGNGSSQHLFAAADARRAGAGWSPPSGRGHAGEAATCQRITSDRSTSTAGWMHAAGPRDEHGAELDSTGRGMSGPRAEERSPASLICRPSLNRQHVPTGGLAAKSCRSPRCPAELLGSGDFPAPRNRMVDSPPLYGTRGRDTGRSSGQTRNATGPGFDSPQLQLPSAKPATGYRLPETKP